MRRIGSSAMSAEAHFTSDLGQWRFPLRLQAHTLQRVNSRRLDLRRQRFQDLKEHQHVGHLVGSDADRAEPFSTPLDLQIPAPYFLPAYLRYRDESALP